MTANAPALQPLQGVRAGLALISICLGALIGSMAATMLSVAYPALLHGFRISYATLMWVNVVYFVVFTVAMPLCGALGDRVGHERIYMLGLGFFALASLCEMLAWNFPTLVVFQLLEGLSGAFMLPSQLALIRRCFRDRQGWAYGYWLMAGNVGALLGPVVGGSLVAGFGWRAIFAWNAVLLLLAVVLAWATLTRLPFLLERSPLDIPGGLALFLAGGALQVWLKVGFDQGWLSFSSLGLLSFTLLGSVLFVLRERHARSPLIPLSLLRKPIFAVTTITGLILMTASFGIDFFVPTYLQEVQQFSPIVAGVVLVTEAIALVLLAPQLGKVTDRFQAPLPAMAGCMVFAVGVVLFALVGRGTALPVFAGGLALAGVGLGLAFPALNKLATQALADTQMGVGLGVYNMGRYFGGALAGTIFGSLFDVAFAQFHLHLPTSGALLLASQRLFESIVLLAAIAGVICGFLFWYSHLYAKVQKGVFPG